MTHFLPYFKNINSEDRTNVVIREVFCHHGLPDNNISDRGPQFISNFWRRINII